MRGIVFGRRRLALPRSLPVIVLIWLSYSNVTTAVSFNESSNETLLRKCCPPREIYSGQSRMDCTPAPNRATELHAVSRRARSQTYGTPRCGDLEVIATTPLGLIESDNYVGGPACLEIVRKVSTAEDLPIVVHCRSSENDTTTEQELDKLSLPRVVTVRRCCPKDTFYDPRTKSCVSLISEIDDVSFVSLEDPFLTLLPSDDSIDFFAMSRGQPRCNLRAIFDYTIDAGDLTFGDRLLKAKLSLSQDGWRKEEVELTEENSCLELPSSGSSTKGERKLILRLCREEEACLGKSCIAKCCLEDQFHMLRKGCQKFTDDIAPFQFHKMLSNVSVDRDFSKEGYGVLVGKPCKFGMYHLDSTTDWTVTPQGYIQLSPVEVYKHREYCMDIYYNATEFAEYLVPFVCFEGMDKSNECELRCTIQTTLQAISCVFLLITLVVYACLPVLQNLHGKTLMCHVASLLSAYVCLVLISLLTPKLSQETIATVSCSVLGYTMLFSFLSAFAWLNVMCFDIWWTFGGLRENISTRGRGHRKRFISYSTYAWGLASVITILAVLADHTESLPTYLRPAIGLASCWFTQGRNRHGEVLFFIGPVTLQVITNIVLFIVTTIHCNKVKAEINRVTSDPSDARNKRFQANRTKLVMNMKLFVVMGVSWIMESVSYFINAYARDLMWREELFYATDVFNCLQGLLIFILFVLKSRVYFALRRRLGFEDKKQGSSNATTIHDPCRMKKSVSNSTIMSTFQVSSTP